MITDLPEWTCPNVPLLRAGGLWFVLSQDPSEGLEMIRNHSKRGVVPGQTATADQDTYAILTLRHIILVRRTRDGSLEWTKPEALFDGENAPSPRSIDLLLLASSGTDRQPTPTPTRLNSLPVEIQDRILRFTSFSTVAAAKLGCEINLGSPFSWRHGRFVLEQEACRRKRLETSPVESQVRFGPFMSAVSYKPQVNSVKPTASSTPPTKLHGQVLWTMSSLHTPSAALTR